jgi:hypothetical protein
LYGDPKRLGFCGLPASFLLGFCCLPLCLRLGFFRQTLRLCLGSAALFFFRCLALRFLSGFSPSFRFDGSPLRFFGRSTLCFRFRRSLCLRRFRPTSGFGLRGVTSGLRLGGTASFRVFSGLSSSLRFRGSPRLGFGRTSLLYLGRPTLGLLTRRTTLRGFLCPLLVLSRPRRVGFALTLRGIRCPPRANPNNALGGVSRRSKSATADGLGEVQSRPASRHRCAARSDDCIARWSAPSPHDRP